jgi:hypothetical protein
MNYSSGSQSGLYRPLGGAVGLPRGALEVGPSERVVRLFTIDQARDWSETPSSLRLLKFYCSYRFQSYFLWSRLFVFTILSCHKIANYW